MLGQFATPLRAALKVANTQAVWWPAKKEPKTLLLFIPGNPGLVDYYTEFLEEIYQSSDPHLEIYGGTDRNRHSGRKEVALNSVKSIPPGPCTASG